MLRKSRPPRDKSEQMIVNNYITIQKILSKKGEPLTEKRLLEIHRLISKNTLANKNEKGFFRTTDDVNVIDVTDGSIIHHPPYTTEIHQLISDLCNFFNYDSQELFIHPIIKGCIIHFMSGYIHPFSDGKEATLLLTVKEIETRFAISNQTARSDLQGLADFGFLEVININLKTQSFAMSNQFEEILKEKLKLKQSTLF